MAPSAPAVLAPATAADLVGEVADGSAELLGALGETPVLAVDLHDDRAMTAPLPPSLACVVVGVSRRRPIDAAPPGVDVALCAGPADGVPPGWVRAEDVDEALEDLVEGVQRSPYVAIAFVHTLRVSEHLDRAEGLVVESLAYSALQGGPAFGAWLAERRRRPAKERAEPDHAVVVERHGDTLVLTLNRPHVRNAVNARLRDELCAGLALASADHTIHHVELRGAGANFSSGGDLDEFGSFPDTTVAHLVRTSRSPARLMLGVAERTTARIHGACVGAGIELSAFARRLIAGPDTRVQLPEVGLGLVPGAGGTVSLPRRIGRQRTTWLGLSGATIEAATALGWGLVDELSR